MEFRVFGMVVERESQRPVPGLRVRAFDRDFLFSDLLGTATTDASGAFMIEYRGEDFQEFLDRRPDLLLEVYAPAQKEARKEEPLYTTEDVIRWEANRLERFRVEIPRARLGPYAPAENPISLLGDDGCTEATFEVGDSLQVCGEGLRPNAALNVRIVDIDGVVVRDHVLKTRTNGVLDPTVIWPNLGVTGYDRPPYEYATFEEAARKLANREFRVEICDGAAVVREAPFRFADAFLRPRVYPVNARGRFTTGFLRGTQDLRIEARNVREATHGRVYLVPRQRDWRIGDPIEPVLGIGGRPVTADFLIDDGRLAGVLWQSDEVQGGAYDLILRPYMRGQAGLDDLALSAHDVVANRRVTTLVVRIDVFAHKAVWLGCVNTQEMAGSLVSGPPYFRFRNTFAKGEPIYASLDPAGLVGQQVGKKIAYYVVQHKTAAQWTADTSLSDVTPGLGKLILMDDCINHNDVLVWPNPQTEGEYDVVVDFGNNDPDPTAFQEDDSFDAPVDMIDGYFVAGFRVVEDPAAAAPHPHVGSLTYAQPAVDIPTPPFWDGTQQYEDPVTEDEILPYPLDAVIRYPAEADGVTVSSAQATYPVVVCVHGQHSWTDPNHEGYIYLLEHLARNGFIAVSINQHQMNRFGLLTDARARGILAHLGFLQQLHTNSSLYGGVLHGKLDLTKIGLMGHSRGGDAVVRTQIFNQNEGLGWGIQAICAISPTDFHGTHPNPAERQKLTQTPYLMIYGANDGDVAGWPNFGGPVQGFTGTGFRTYDRSTSEKTALYVRKGTHNRFNTVWGAEGGVDLSNPSDILSATLHQVVAKGSMNAFFQLHLQSKVSLRVFLNGEAEPPAMAPVEMDLQYSYPDRLVLDDFEPSPGYDTGTNSLNGNVTSTDLDALDENLMHVLDPKSAHQTSGGKIVWSQTSARYRSVIPDHNSQRDVSSFKAFTLRVAQQWEPQGQADPLQDFYVTLKSGDPNNAATHKIRSIRAGSFVAVREPYYPKITAAYVNSYGQPARSVFTTLRIPLDAWTIKCMNADIVDLQNVFEVEMGFFAKPNGKLGFDSIAFTK